MLSAQCQYRVSHWSRGRGYKWHVDLTDKTALYSAPLGIHTCLYTCTHAAWGERKRGEKGRGGGRLKNESCCFAGSTIDLGVREVDRTKLKGDRRQPSKKTPLHILSLPSLFSTKKKKKHHLLFFFFFFFLLNSFPIFFAASCLDIATKAAIRRRQYKTPKKRRRLKSVERWSREWIRGCSSFERG